MNGCASEVNVTGRLTRGLVEGWWGMANGRCVGEWNRRQRSSADSIHWSQLALSLVNNQWRWRVSRWPLQSSRSTAQQPTEARTRPDKRLSSQVVVAAQTSLQQTHISAVHSTWQQWVEDVGWRDITVESALSDKTHRNLSIKRLNIKTKLMFVISRTFRIYTIVLSRSSLLGSKSDYPFRIFYPNFSTPAMHFWTERWEEISNEVDGPMCLGGPMDRCVSVVTDDVQLKCWLHRVDWSYDLWHHTWPQRHDIHYVVS